MNTEMNTNKEFKSQEDLLDTTDRQDFGIKIVEGTPIAILSSDRGHFGVIGKNRVTDIYNNYEECLKICKGIPTWEMITSLIERVVEITLNNKENE